MVRKKNRYVLAELVYEENNKVYPLTNSQLYQAIRSAFKTCFGDYGIALVKASLSVKLMTDDTKIILVRIRRGAEAMLCNSLLTMKSLSDVPMKVVTLHTSGSIRCAQKYWIKHSRRRLNQILKTVTNTEERHKLQLQINSMSNIDITDIFKRVTKTRDKAT